MVIAQAPIYTPDSAPRYPVFDVNLQNPLPPQDVFIASSATFILPPVLGFFGILISVSIFKAIVRAFNKD